jgi:hypothetical protein
MLVILCIYRKKDFLIHIIDCFLGYTWNGRSNGFLFMNFVDIACGSYWIWCTRIKNKLLVLILDEVFWISVLFLLYFSACKDYTDHFHSSMDNFKVSCNYLIYTHLYFLIWIVFFISKIWYLLVFFVLIQVWVSFVLSIICVYVYIYINMKHPSSFSVLCSSYWFMLMVTFRPLPKFRFITVFSTCAVGNLL